MPQAIGCGVLGNPPSALPMGLFGPDDLARRCRSLNRRLSLHRIQRPAVAGFPFRPNIRHPAQKRLSRQCSGSERGDLGEPAIYREALAENATLVQPLPDGGPEHPVSIPFRALTNRTDARPPFLQTLQSLAALKSQRPIRFDSSDVAECSPGPHSQVFRMERALSRAPRPRHGKNGCRLQSADRSGIPGHDV